MKALCVRAPWWWYILHGGKDIENRDWPTRVRGRVLIHASKWWNYREIEIDAFDANKLAAERAQLSYRELRNGTLKDSCGCLVGSVEIVDCVARSNSPWFVGDCGFVLRDPVTFIEPIPFKGTLGFFGVPDDLVITK
jgi:hypothetical protein